jgi:hypothetical protein
MKIWIERSQQHDNYYLHFEEPVHYKPVYDGCPGRWVSHERIKLPGMFLVSHILDELGVAPPARGNLLEIEVSSKLIAHWRP